MAKAKLTRCFTPNNPTAPQLCPALAKEIGLNESILLLQWEYWILTEGQERDGHVWLRKTVREIQETFPFWGVATIHRTLQSLVSEKRPLLVVGNYDEGPGRASGWFRLNFEALQKLKSIKVDCSIVEQRMFQPGTKFDQNGTSDLISIKDKDIYTDKPSSPSGYKQPKRVKVLLPADFEVTDGMRNWAHGLGLSDARITNCSERYIRHVTKTEKKLYPEHWPTDWEEWVLNDVNFNGNGHKASADDDEPRGNPSFMAPEKPVDYFEKINAQYRGK